MESLEEYVLVMQDKMKGTVLRRANAWQLEILTKSKHNLRLSSIAFSLSIQGVYEG